MSEDFLIMFAKAPVAGRVKTRLARRVGAEVAADVQTCFLRDLGERFSRFSGRRILAVSPDLDHPAFSELTASGWVCWPQGGGDLGTRLARVQRRAFNEGAKRALIIGSDSPTLPLALVEQARRLLAACDVVVGPVPDGGYYLVGTSRDVSVHLDAIDWGTHRVYSQTVERLERAGVSYGVLPFWYDIDDFEALKVLRTQLSLTGPYGPLEAENTLRYLSTRPELFEDV